MKNNNIVEVDEIPYCDACHHHAIERFKNGEGFSKVPKAKYDCKTNEGWWGYFCQTHFEYFQAKLGLGKGQMLVEKK